MKKLFKHYCQNPMIGLLVLAVLVYSCSNDEPTPKENDNNVAIDSIPKVPKDTVVPDLGFVPIGKVQQLNPDKIDDNFILVNDAGANRAYIMDKNAQLLHEWEFTNNIGNDVFVLPNGNLLASLESDDPKVKLGGQGGRLQIIHPDNTVSWDFIYSTPEAETHHDAELLPNGNVLAMVWGKRSKEEAVDNGYMMDEDIFVESIIEVDTTTNEIVWQWDSMDDIIQDHDASLPNFGTISEHPERIDLNYIPKSETPIEIKGDIMHANGITYDEYNDVILLSVLYYSEVWVIDHSTTSQEAEGSSGGSFGKGGDLIYRFGNPEAYENTFGNRIFQFNHYPNLLKGEDQGKLLIFSNGKGIGQSTVFELELPVVYSLGANKNNEPKVVWYFTDPDLYSPKVSGAVKLPNGNILITEGDFGFWEVTREKEVVWKFNAPGFFWRGYSYDKDSPEIKKLGL